MVALLEQPALLSTGWQFECHWSPRAEDGRAIAGRLQALATRLRKLDLFYGKIWPVLEMRGPTKSEPHILEMSADTLGMLIERRGRFDPPAWPQPVDRYGYSIAATGERDGHDPESLMILMGAGVLRQGPNRNELVMHLHKDGLIWRDPELGRGVLRALVEALEPLLVFGGAMYERQYEPEMGPYRFRPWLAWLKAGVEAPDYFDAPLPPASETEDCGGRLFFWP